MRPLKQQNGNHKRKGYQYHNNIDLSGMCADIHYFLVMPFAAQQANRSENYQSVPYALTYLNDEIKVYQLMRDYRRAYEQLKDRYIYFTFGDGRRVNEGMTILGMKKQLARQNLNGLVLFIKQDPDLQGSHFEDYLDQDFNYAQINQKGVLQYLSNQDQFGNENQMIILVQIPQKYKSISEIMTIWISGQSTLEDFKQIIINQMKKQFAIQLKLEDILQLIIKDINIPLNNYGTLIHQRIQNRNSIVILTLANPNIKLKRLKNKDYNSYLVIRKQGESCSQKLRYSQVSQLTFNELYFALGLKGLQKRDGLNFALKIMDLIIKPSDKINIAEKYFKNINKQPLNIIGNIISQKMVFCDLVPNLFSKEKDFIIEEYIKLPPNQIEKLRKFRKLVEQKAKQPQNQYFKRIEKIQPLLIYISDIRIVEQQNKIQRINESLNNLLKQKSVLCYEPSQLQNQWRYLYCSTLMHTLNKIPKYKGKAYLGINYNPQTLKGQTMTFKQFVSVSIDCDRALQVASKNQNLIKNMLELNLLEGYLLQQFSQFSSVKQVLLEPFTSFQVAQIKNINQDVINKGNIKVKKVFNYTIYVLNQKQTQKTQTNLKNSVVIWVDPNSQQAFNIFNQLKPLNLTIGLVQLSSTEQLKNWLLINKNLLHDPTSNLMFITNMTRCEDNKWNQIAGIEGLNIIRTYSKQFPVLFYIGNENKGKKKIKENGVNIQNVFIGSSPSIVLKFLQSFTNRKI